VIIRLERVLGSVEENKRDFYFESFKKVSQIELKEQVVHVFFIITALSASHLLLSPLLVFFSYCWVLPSSSSSSRYYVVVVGKVGRRMLE
jgi:hypothetical protein